MEIVRQEVVASNRVDISEFGVFQALKKPEYILVDPEVGERYLMPPSVEVVFEAALTASDPETPEVGHALHFIPDASFVEEANSPFALFEPTLVNEGVHFPGLTEVVVHEPKAAEEGVETETDTDESATLDIPETSKVPETPETAEVPDIHEVNEVLVPSHQRKRPPIWIPILGGALVALVAFLFSRRRESGE